MQNNTIFLKRYTGDDEAFRINEREVWRYSGCKASENIADGELRAVYNEVIRNMKNKLSYKVCYRRMEIEWADRLPLLPFSSESNDLARCLRGCKEIVLFAATIGLEPDRYIARYQRFSPVRALLMQAYGAERVECLCNVFCDEIKELVAAEGLSCTARFSPGYGDLPLDIQKDLFRLLDCNRQIGISLNESLLMTPSKSVTAIFGIGPCVGSHHEHKCENCKNTDCEFRA